MTHAQQEVGLGAVRALGVLLGLDQPALIGLFLLALNLLLSQVLLDDVVDELERHEHVAVIVHLDHQEPVVVHLALIKAAIGSRVLALPRLEHPADILRTQLVAHPLFVLVVHAGIDPVAQHGLVREYPVLERDDLGHVVIIGDLHDLGGAGVHVGQIDVAIAA